MIFIDWMSTPYHKNFNRAFFDSIKPINGNCYVFNSSLLINELNCINIDSSTNRFLRAIKVFHICLKNKDQNLFFLTYDPLFIPLIKLIKGNIIVFEHNTTPDETKSKFYKIFQNLFYKNILRLAQFRGQYDVLKDMNQMVSYVGSPLRKKNNNEIAKENVASNNKYFILPSYRASMSKFNLISNLIAPNLIYVKSNQNNIYNQEFSKYENVFPIKNIELESDCRNIAGTFINIDSNSRGTGWYNESITHGIPIIICNNKTEQLFKETFPSYPYVKIDKNTTNEIFNKKFESLKDYNNLDYIEKYNIEFKRKYLNSIDI